jgi:AraC-like DNA-binding protein
MLENLYIINCTVSLVLIFEISKFYKNNSIMRFQFIGLLASLLLLNLYYLVFYNYWFSFLFNITATLGIIVFILNIFSLLFSYKINRRVIYFSIALYLIALFFLLLKLYTNHELKEEDYAPFVSNEDQLGNIIKGIIYFLFGSIFFIYCIFILKKINKEFYYHRLLKNWIYVFLILLIVAQVISFLSLFNDFYIINKFVMNQLKFGVFIQEFLYFFVLLRPNFLDAHELKYSISEIMDLSQKKGLSETINNNFFKEKYYLKPEATLSKFSQLIKSSNDDVNDFIILKYHQNFIDLVNIHRIQHFILLVDQGKHKELTIEYLGNQCGFSTRQALYLSFMKFKGCSPSDYISSLNN